MATFPPVTLIVGEEEFLVDRALRQAVAEARAALAAETGDGGGDVHDLEAAALGAGELAALTSPSLFGGGAVVIVRNGQNAVKETAADITRYAAQPAPDAAVIVTHAGGAKGKALVTDLTRAKVTVISCPKLTRASERTDFVRAELRRVGRQADEGAVRALLDAIGADLRELASAVDQLASDTEKGRINAATVARYYRGRAEATGFSVADHAVEGRLSEALEQLRWALSTGTSPVLINSALAQGVRLLGRVGGAPRGMNPNVLAAEVGAPPWKIDRVRQQLRGWHPDGVARAIGAVAEADAQVKGGGASPEYALERAIRQIVTCRLSAPAPSPRR